MAELSYEERRKKELSEMYTSEDAIKNNIFIAQGSCHVASKEVIEATKKLIIPSEFLKRKK
jgi:hypothetical protein